MITSIPPPMHRMPQECIRGTQQYCRLGQSGALGDLVAQPGEEAVGPASRSFMACMHEAELLEQEAAELHAAAARKDAEAASKRLAALDSFNVALSSTPAAGADPHLERRVAGGAASVSCPWCGQHLHDAHTHRPHALHCPSPHHRDNGAQRLGNDRVHPGHGAE